ncbi:hypothetical protein AAHA92_17729 [Salvia divinorum]|uniref:Uncharacterized protein n=1 Tax=Salvia divinorum TaxID=28513 RepID=A0ABD1H2X5_SALDI
MNSNTVSALELIWNKLLMKNKLIAAYNYVCEPEYNMVSMLFGITTVKKEKDISVINISNTKVPLDVGAGGPWLDAQDNAPSTEGSESVCSPVMQPG